MIDMESKAGRRIIGRIDSGRALEESILSVCRKYSVEACEVRLTGILKDPILLSYREEDGEFTGAYRVGGLATLVSFRGDVSLLGSELILNAKAVVAWDDRGFPRMVGGHLKSATVHSAEFVIETFDDRVLERGFDPLTRLPLWTAISRKEIREDGSRPGTPVPTSRRPTPAPGHKGGAEPRKRSSASSKSTRPKSPLPIDEPLEETPRTVASMADDMEKGPELKPAMNERNVEVVRRPAMRKGIWKEALSRSLELDQEEDEDIDLMQGDLLEHPKFGKCVVLNVDEDERITVRRPGGGRATLALSHMKLFASGTTETGKTIYRLTMIRA